MFVYSISYILLPILIASFACTGRLFAEHMIDPVLTTILNTVARQLWLCKYVLAYSMYKLRSIQFLSSFFAARLILSSSWQDILTLLLLSKINRKNVNIVHIKATIQIFFRAFGHLQVDYAWTRGS